MSLGNYGQLKAAVLSWTDRAGHAGSVAAVPDWIALAEADIRADIITRNVTRKTDLVLNSGAVALPADVKKPTDLVLTESQYAGAVRIVSPTQLYETAGWYTSTGRPQVAALVNGTLLLAPAPDRSYVATLIYEPLLAALVQDGETNWVLTNHPNVYLYGALKHAALWLKDPEGSATWAEMYNEHVGRLEREKADYEYGPGALVARPPFPIG